MANNPTLLTQPIAANGAKNVIPNTTSTAGAMSQDQGFPAETALPLGAGGVAPTREDFNGAFNLLSGIAFMAQKGFVFNFDNTQDYYVGCVVVDTTDGKKYECIVDAPAGTGEPHETPANWKLGADMSEYTKTINCPMFNKRDVITTSGTYTAPVTGWYKITAKGGGGGGENAIKLSQYVCGGSSGGEGGTAITYERMEAGDTVAVTIGAGGAAGVAGGNSSVVLNGNTYTGGGGGGTTGLGGLGGTGTIAGACGQSREFYFSGAGSVYGRSGGGHGGAITSVSSTPSQGINGGGGAGGSVIGANVYSGGAGGNGYVWFEYFDSTLNP